MEKIATLFFATLAMALCATQQANATIIRVNNKPGSYTYDKPTAPVSDPDRKKYIYKSAQLAHNAADPGDTLHIEPSTIAYDQLIMVKNLTVIGNGYFLKRNSTPALPLQANKDSSTIHSIYFNPGSDYSKVTGLVLQYGIVIKADHISVERNCILNVYNYPYKGEPYGIYLQNNVDSVFIIQNYINGHVYSATGTASVDSFIYIYNNYIGQSIDFQGEDKDIYIMNNIIEMGTASVSSVSRAVVENNIFTKYNIFNISNSFVHNNICNSIQLPATDGNQQNVNMNTVFDLNYPSPDGKYKLIPGSPAIGAGVGGVDCGMYATPATVPLGYTAPLSPYKLSGLPTVPSIYQLDATVSGNILNVTISTKSNN